MCESIGIERIEKQPPAGADISGWLVSWERLMDIANPALRCAIVTGNVTPVKRIGWKNGCGKRRHPHSRRRPSKLRIPCRTCAAQAHADCFLAAFDEGNTKKLAEDISAHNCDRKESCSNAMPAVPPRLTFSCSTCQKQKIASRRRKPLFSGENRCPHRATSMRQDIVSGTTVVSQRMRKLTWTAVAVAKSALPHVSATFRHAVSEGIVSQG